MKKIITLATFSAVLLFIVSSSWVYAKDPGACRTIYHKEGQIYEIKSAMYNGTYIRLPNKLMIDPVPGDSGLWTVEGDGHHIMVQPNSSQSQGKRTTLTLIDTQNRSYNFRLIRVKATDNFDTCVTIKLDPQFFQGTKLSTYQTPDEEAQKRLTQQVQVLKGMLIEEKKQSDKKIDSFLKKYRTFIYTRYKWKAPITDVYDDGRFTFIRVEPGHRGMLVISADVDDKKEMIEYGTESDSLYSISGIYDDLSLKYGKSEIKIKRKDNKNNGVY